MPFPWLLLHPNIPKPLHGVNPRTIMGKGWWDEQRQIAYKKYNYTCWACGVSKYDAEYYQWLEAHEIYSYDYVKGKLTFLGISALCHLCHNAIHSGRLRVLLEKREIKQEFFDAVIKHKADVLDCININTPNWEQKIKNLGWVYEKDTVAGVAWRDWRLVFMGKEYEPIHRSSGAWVDYYNT